MQPEGTEVKVQSVQSSRQKFNDENRRIYAIVAYHFPQYTIQDVENMPYRDVVLLLSTAARIDAERMYNLTMIASAPQSKNGKGVKTLLKYFKEIINK